VIVYSLQLLQLEGQADQHAAEERRVPSDGPDYCQRPGARLVDQHGAEGNPKARR
jgi:hypothetical protein